MHPTPVNTAFGSHSGGPNAPDPSKTTYLDTYSHSFAPEINEKLRKLWIGVLRQKKLLKGESFNLDFHSIPFFGADEFVERHYLSKRRAAAKSRFWFSWRKMPKAMCSVTPRP